MIVPVDYAPKKKSLVDTVIDIKKEKIDALKASIGTLHKDLQKLGHPIDISEENVIESAIIMLDADENIDQSITILPDESNTMDNDFSIENDANQASNCVETSIGSASKNTNDMVSTSLNSL